MKKSKGKGTEFSDFNFNPVWGCGNGCEYCYARKVAKRFWKKILEKEDKHRPRIAKDVLEMAKKIKNFEPIWLESNYCREIPKKANYIFVNSMSDPLYWEAEWWLKIAIKIIENSDKMFLIFTKDIRFVTRSLFEKYFDCFKNVAIVFSVTNQKQFDTLMSSNICNLGSLKKGICFEPLLEKIDPYCVDIFDWIVIGQETGKKNAVQVPFDWLVPFVNYSLIRDKLYIKTSLHKVLPDFIPKYRNYGNIDIKKLNKS